MALTPDQAKELRDMLKEIEQLSIKLKANINTTSLQDVETNAGNIKRLFKDLKEEWNDLTADISGATQGFRDIVKEISNQNIGLNDSLKAYKGLVSIADKVQAYQRGYGELTTKEINKLKERIQLEKLRIENSQILLQEEGKAIKIREKALKDEIKASEVKINALQNDRKASLAEIRNREKLKNELTKINKEHLKITASIKQNVVLLNDQDETFKNLDLSIGEVARKINQEFVQNLDKNFKNLVNETQKTDSSIKKIAKSFDVLTSIAQKVQDHQSEITELGDKEAKKLLEKLESEKKRVATNQELLKIERDALKSKELSNKLELDIKKTAIEDLENEAKSRKLTKDELTDLKKLKEEESVLLETRKDINSELEINEKTQEKISKLIKGQDEVYNKIRSSINNISKESKISSINKIDESFKNIVNEIGTTDQIVKKISKTFENLSGISEKLQEYQGNITEVNKEDVKELIKKVELEKQSLANSLKLLELEKQRLQASSAANNNTLQNIEAEINALQSRGTLTDNEIAQLTELETKKSSLLEIEDDINAQLETNNKLTEKTREYISGQNEEYQKLNDTLKDTESRVSNMDKSFGLNIGKNLKGALGKAGLGNLADMLGIDKATAKMKNLTTEYTKGGKQALTFGQQFKVIGGGLASMGGNLLKGFNPVMLALTGIVKLVQFFIEAMFEADQQVTDIAKSMVISKEAARGVRDRFFEISDNAKIYAGTLDNQLLTQKELVAANLKINELLGTSIDFSSQLGDKGKYIVAQFAAASKFLKLSEEEQKGLLDLQSTSGEEINKIRNTVLGTTSLYKIQTGILLNERKVLENVLKASNAIKLSTKGGLEGLTKSAIEAAKLGLSLQKVSDIAGGLLDFEAQITAELEAELITGREINLELAQQAALNNDLATVASEVAKNVGSAADFAKMNRLEQEAFAKAVFMSREELADLLTTQENLNKLKGKFNALTETEKKQLEDSGKLTAGQIATLRTGKGTVVEYYSALQQAGVAQKDIIELLGDQAYASLSSQTAQEKFNESLEAAKEIFSRFVDGGTLDDLADMITRLVKSIQIKGFLGTLLGGEATEKEMAQFDIKQKEIELSQITGTTPEDIEKRKQLEGEITKLKEAEFNRAKKEQIDRFAASGKSEAEALSQMKANEEYKKSLTSDTGQTNALYGIYDPKKAKEQGIDAETLKAYGAAQQDKAYFTGGAAKGFATGGIITKRIDNATIGEAGPEAVIPLESSIGKRILNIDQNSTSPSSNDIVNSVVSLIDKISSTVSNITPSTANYSKTNMLEQEALAKAVDLTREELSNILTAQQNASILPENNIRPSKTELETRLETELMTGVKTQPSTSNTNVTVDNSPVVAAVNKLTEALMANNNKEITITMNGEVVGKTLVNIMTPGVIRETNLISQPA